MPLLSLFRLPESEVQAGVAVADVLHHLLDPVDFAGGDASGLYVASEYVASGSSGTYAALYNITAALSAVLVVAAAAACVTGSRALSDLISSPGGKLQKRTPAFAIAAGLCLAAAGVMMAVVSLVYVGKMGNEALSAALGVPIGLAVIGVLMCVLAIVRKKFSLPEEEPADVVPALS